ncbi:MAG: hypothetical protein HYZ09_03820 [Candidatus Kerfeldbacteria bacterium]|nr:hypothetical protein [Candidatus Kerfeldbacteria bacterium]
MFSGRFGNWCEALARNAQKRKMESVARTSPLRRVVITDDVLKFHEEDRRQQYNLRFLEQRERLLGQR